MPHTFSSNTALLVIDVQQSFEHRPYWVEAETREFKTNIQQLIGFFEQSNQKSQAGSLHLTRRPKLAAVR